MMLSLATKVLLAMAVFALPQESLAAHNNNNNNNDNNNNKTRSALTLLLGKTSLNFSILPSRSPSSSAETKEQSWTCNDSEFLHHLLPQSGGPCDCSGDSSGCHLPRSSTRSMSQRKSDSFRRHLELNKSTKSPSSSSSGKKKSVTPAPTPAPVTPAPTPAPVTPAPTPAPQVPEPVCAAAPDPCCLTCCGGNSGTTQGTQGDCVNGDNFLSTLTSDGDSLYCRWLGRASSAECQAAGFAFAESTCFGNYDLQGYCGVGAGDGRKLKLAHLDGYTEDEEQKSIAMKKHKTVMGFVRIPKTGSTTMSRFLETVAYLFDWYYHLSSNGKDHPEDPSVVVVVNDDAKEQEQQNNNNNKAAGNGGAISCIFAHVPTTAHLGSNFHDAASKKTNQDTWWNLCPHIPYSGLLKQWSKSLDKWSVPETAVVEQDDDNHGAMMTPFSFGFQAFSMVRDPFDRLVSYFSYLGKFTDTTEFLKETVTVEQYEKIKAGDLRGWMELLHEQGGGCGLKLPYQFHYFHEDLDTAIDLIEVGKDGKAPKIFTLVTECYEASLYLLAEVVEGLEPDHVKDFVNSPGYMSNKNKNSITNQDSYGEGKEEDSLGDLRVLARYWFQEDFVFFDAAVAQFKEYLAKSDVDPVHLKGCVHWEDAVAAS